MERQPALVQLSVVAPPSLSAGLFFHGRKLEERRQPALESALLQRPPLSVCSFGSRRLACTRVRMYSGLTKSKRLAACSSAINTLCPWNQTRHGERVTVCRKNVDTREHACDSLSRQVPRLGIDRGPVGVGAAHLATRS